MGWSGKKATAKGRGFTLLEILVATAVGVVIFGIALGVLIATNQSTNKIIAREALLQQAQVAMEEVRATLEAVVWPEDLATSAPAQAKPVFEKDRLGLFSSHRPAAGGGFCYYLFRNDKEAGAGYERLEPGTKAAKFEKLGAGYEARFEFRYAASVGDDLKPAWREKLGPSERPRLVWVRLALTDPKHRDRRGENISVSLETAISL